MMKNYSVSFTAWEVTQPDDGGMRNEHLAYFSSRIEADKYVAQAKGWPRHMNQITINKSWTVFDSVNELNELKLENLKERALAKLTEEERELLGI